MNTKLNKLIIFFGIIVAFSLASNAYAGWGKHSASWDNYAIGELPSGPGQQHELAKGVDSNIPANATHDRLGSKGIFVSGTERVEPVNTSGFTQESALRKNVITGKQIESERGLDKNRNRYLSDNGTRGVFIGHDSKCTGMC